MSEYYFKNFKNYVTVLFLLSLTLITIKQVYAQTQFRTLDPGNIAATFNNSGSLFWDQNHTQQFEAPKHSGVHSVFATSLCVGALNTQTGDLYLAGTMFNTNGTDFYPGPVTDSSYRTLEQIKYNRIWKVSCSEVENFKAYSACDLNPACNTVTQFPGYTIPNDILEWPTNGDTLKGQDKNLAPFFDANSDGDYNVNDGDYPLIEKGDVMLYFLLNDQGPHTETGGKPLGFDFHVTAYAYEKANEKAIDNTIFINYRIVNRSSNSYYNTYFGIFTDFDLGNGRDDYIGSDPYLNLYYTYNGDNFDEDGFGALGYKDTLAAQGVAFLGGPKLDDDGIDNPSSFNNPGLSNGFGFGDGIIDNERLGMSNFMYFNNSNNTMGNPSSALDYYNYMNSIWKTGSKLAYGGSGNPSTCSTPFTCNTAKYAFPGTSDTSGLGTQGNTQIPWDESLVSRPPGDRRGIGSIGGFTFPSGASKELDIAYVFARSDSANNPTDAIRKLKHYVRSLTLDSLTSSCTTFPVGLHESVPTKLEVGVFPNPAKDVLNINSNSELSYKVYNVLGAIQLQGEFKKGSNQIRIRNLHSGTYLIQTFSETSRKTVKFIKR